MPNSPDALSSYGQLPARTAVGVSGRQWGKVYNAYLQGTFILIGMGWEL